MELQQRYSHSNLAFLAAGIEAVVYGSYHILRHSAPIVYDLYGEQVALYAVFHLNGYLGCTRTDGIVRYVNNVKVKTFHITGLQALPGGGLP